MTDKTGDTPPVPENPNDDFLARIGGERFGTILADPPWQFQNRTGKMAPEHKRLQRYPTMTLDQICDLPVEVAAADRAHLYLWVPNALLPEGLKVMAHWGFRYKTNLIWFKSRKDGGPDRRGVGFYFRNVTEVLLFGVRGKDVRTEAPARSIPNSLGQPDPEAAMAETGNVLNAMKREHSRKPDEQYELIEKCSWGPRLEMFARGPREGWRTWGNQADDYVPTWDTYANHSQSKVVKLKG